MRTGMSRTLRAAAVSFVMAFAALPAHAAMLSGDLTFSGDWATTGSLGTATGFTFPGNDFDVDGANGDFGGIPQGDIGFISDFSLVVEGGTSSLIEIAGFAFDVVDQRPS